MRDSVQIDETQEEAIVKYIQDRCDYPNPILTKREGMSASLVRSGNIVKALQLSGENVGYRTIGEASDTQRLSVYHRQENGSNDLEIIELDTLTRKALDSIGLREIETASTEQKSDKYLVHLR